MSELLARLRRRKVVQWLAAYAAGAWVLLQVASLLAGTYGWPPLAMRVAVAAAAVGFFVALVLAWYHGERGAQRVGGTELAILALLLACGGALMWRIGSNARPARDPPAGSDSARDATATVPEKSIAVLPFANAGGKADEQYFSDGLSEDLIGALSQFAGLKVIGRNSSFRFRDSSRDPRSIGADLGVAHLLEGSVRREGDHVRISAELVSAGDGSTQWSQRYDRPYRDLFALQDEIAQAVASALRAKLLSGNAAAMPGERPPGGNLDAYNAFLQGWYYYSRRTETDFRKALAYFDDAVRIDPGYAYALATQSRTWTSLAVEFLSGDEARHAYEQGRAAADRALALAPDLAVAHVARGFWLQTAAFDWQGATAEYARARQLAPDDATTGFAFGFGSASLGRLDVAADLIGKALEADPLHASWYTVQANVLAAAGRPDAASRAIRKAVDLQPAASNYRHRLVVLAILHGDMASARAEAERIPAGLWRDVAAAFVAQSGTDGAVADAALRQLIDRHAQGEAYQIASAYVLRHDSDAVFEWLDRAWAARDPGLTGLLYDPLLLRMRSDPRFAVFCRRIGLPAPSAAAPAAPAAPP